jgi:hypothetical protein
MRIEFPDAVYRVTSRDDSELESSLACCPFDIGARSGVKVRGQVLPVAGVLRLRSCTPAPIRAKHATLLVATSKRPSLKA